ncbi:phospholipase A [Noviherbaspirillum sp.]|uniref:phospholipase A n=1 Tax=Noviherbaspirillum sp. TaxID=1926288 RepID=UPI002FE07E95
MALTAFASEEARSLAECARITDDGKRLTCFDRLAASNDQAAGAAKPGLPPIPHAETAGSWSGSAQSNDPGRFSLSDHWELEQGYKRGIFTFRPHRPNYLTAVYTHRPNDAPYRPFRQLTSPTAEISHTELAFQLGFKMKLAQDVLGKVGDLWFGYTQNSYWQADNQEASSPFRETNYQPELMAVVPVNFSFLGMNARFINVGLVHQSNGQTSTLSRSWNRIYAQVGMERGDFTLLARVWKRLPEKSEEDNNPNIADYMGRGDVSAVYRYNGHEFSTLARYNFHTDKGAAQLSWAFPLAGYLKGYVQVFSGYGQSLIDYNYFHRTIGVGIQADF